MRQLLGYLRIILGRWRFVAGVSAIFLALAPFAWSEAIPAGSWRYKVTVEVDTPEGPKSGSAVREATVHSKRSIFGKRSTWITVKGEAVIVDLGERGVLFSIMGKTDYSIVFRSFPVPGNGPGAGGLTPKGIEYYKKLKKAGDVLIPEQYPMLVHFRDLSDPNTVELVLETNGCRQQNAQGLCVDGELRVVKNRFEEFFGTGVSLKKIRIEMTDETVTERIIAFLPWLLKVGGGYLDGSFASQSKKLSNRLDGGQFKTGG